MKLYFVVLSVICFTSFAADQDHKSDSSSIASALTKARDTLTREQFDKFSRYLDDACKLTRPGTAPQTFSLPHGTTATPIPPTHPQAR